MSELKPCYCPELEALITEREGYIAENAQRSVCGSFMAYGSDHFQEIASRMRELTSTTCPLLAAKDAEIARLREALEAIQRIEPEFCRTCSGSGEMYADGKSHYPSQCAPTRACPSCGGEGVVIATYRIMEIVADALNRGGTTWRT